MKLLYFAHRGEAQTFLSKKTKKIKDDILEIYESDSEYILIGSEGIQNTTEKLTIALMKLPQVSEVINIGVCGALDKKYPLNSIYQIRTVYQFVDNDPSFKSFSSDKGDTDIITTNKRIKETLDKEKLEKFAPLVDRELWAIASVSKTLKKKWSSIKLVSDDAFEDTDCASVLAQSKSFSDKLFNFYKKENPQREHSQKEKTADLNSDFFYFTHSQKNNFDKLIKSYQSLHNLSLEESLKKLLKKELLAKKITPKKRAQLLLNDLLKEVDPISFKAKNEIHKYLKSISNNNFIIHNDQTLESNSIKIEASINNQKDLLNFTQEVSKVSFEKIENILTGKNV